MSANDIAFSVVIKNDGISDIIFKTIMLKGDKGNSVSRVEKTSTSGLVDTYTIYLTDGTIGGTFTVTNGSPVNIDDTVTANDKTWSSQKLSGMIKEIDDSDVDADKLWSSEKINSLIPQTATIEDVAIASFSDGADDLPVSELIVDIEAVQAGSGEPSPDNVRTISGWSECNITACGVNLFDKDTVTSGRLINGGGNDVSFTGWNVSDYIPVKEGAELYLYGLTDHPNTNQDNFIFFDASKTQIGFANVKTWEYPLTIPSGAKFVKCTCKDIDLNTAQFSPTNNAPYQSYMGNTATIEFGQTIFGAKLNILTGLMTVIEVGMLYNGTEDGWAWYDDYKQASIALPYMAKYNSSIISYKCNRLTPTINESRPLAIGNFSSLISNGANGAFSAPDCNSLNDFKTWAGNNNIQFVYEIAEPVEIQLSPVEVKTLLKNNNIYADTGNINKLVYFKTGSEAVAKLIEAYMRAQPEE